MATFITLIILTNNPNIPPIVTALKTIQLDFGTIELRSDNIISFEPIEGLTTFTMDQLTVMLNVFLEISEGEPRPYFSNNYNLKSLGGKERIYITENFHRFACAFAMTENSAVTRFITHTFMAISRPQIPVKMFKEKEPAYAWLRTFNK
ncbi:MAG: hypothetical protein KDD24_09790 [Flavobacteriales bacterium]|nr:hypothetical protein [Flavobacteriales bacterium]MCB9174042.1 hypothetical protein [Flavobacteriales bacterium]